MRDAGWREPFERALDDRPNDQAARRDLADHLEERGDPDAEAVRWLANRGQHPLFRDLASAWLWASEDSALRLGRLPPALWTRLQADESISYRGCKEYATRRAAEADFCRAFHAAKAAGWDPTAD